MIKVFPVSYAVVCDSLGCERISVARPTWEEAISYATRIEGFTEIRDAGGLIRTYCHKCYSSVEKTIGLCQEAGCKELCEGKKEKFCYDHNPENRCSLPGCRGVRVRGLDYCLHHCRQFLSATATTLAQSELRAKRRRFDSD